MSRMKSVSVVTAVALALFAASLVHAQQGSTSSSTPATRSAPAKAPSHTVKAAAKHAMPKLDVNSATKDELMKLPGVGDAMADKIIADRPFKAKSELVSKGVMTKAEYAKVASRLIAKQEVKK